MGMTIDEARNMLMIIENSTESLKTAIEIMRKYRKIEQILDDCDLEAWEVLEKIKEVSK